MPRHINGSCVKCVLKGEIGRCCSLSGQTFACSWTLCSAEFLRLSLNFHGLIFSRTRDMVNIPRKTKSCLHFCSLSKSTPQLQFVSRRAHGKTLQEDVSCRAKCFKPLSRWPSILLGVLSSNTISSGEHNLYLRNRGRYTIKYSPQKDLHRTSRIAISHVESLSLIRVKFLSPVYLSRFETSVYVLGFFKFSFQGWWS